MPHTGTMPEVYPMAKFHRTLRAAARVAGEGATRREGATATSGGVGCLGSKKIFPGWGSATGALTILVQRETTTHGGDICYTFPLDVVVFMLI